MASTRTIAAGLHTNAYTINTNGYTLVDLGTVSVTSPIAIEFLGRGDTLNAFGAITGASYAVLFAPDILNRLIINPGASFSGVVSGGNTLGAKTITTMELASGATAGTLNGLNSAYIDFGQVTVDFGATWLLAGGSTVGNHQTVTNAGYLVNSAGAAGTIFTAGLGSAGNAGLMLAAGGVVNNSGRIGGGAGGAGYKGLDGVVSPPPQAGWQGGAGGAGVVATAARVTNTGTVIGGAGGAGGVGGNFVNLGGDSLPGAAGGPGGTGGLGVSLASNATLTNSGGLISGGAGGGGGAGGYPFGVGGNGGAGGGAVYGTSGAVDNFANIQGGSGGPGGFGGNGFGNGSTGSGGIGIQLTGGGTVVNETGGLIAGGALPGSLYADAILIGTGASRVVIHPGATFEGNVDGGNTIGSAISALELTAGAAAGTLSGGIGTKYSHFSQVTIDAGAQWTITAAASLTGVVLTDSGTLTNAATISEGSGAAGFGITLAAGAMLTNDGRIADTYHNGINGTGTVINNGQVYGSNLAGSGVYLAGGGYVANQSSATILGQFGIVGGSAPLTVQNHGLVEAFTTGSGSAIYLAGGSVTNLAGGTIQGYYGVKTRAGPVTVTNAGKILSSGAGLRVGVLLQADGAVTNLPTGYIEGNFYGIASRGVTTIDNYGTIAGADSGAILFEFGYGSGYAGRLVLHPGGVIQGVVKGADKLGHTNLDTLELASNTFAASGTMTGLSTSFVNFAQIVVDPNATWHFSGTNTVSYGSTLFNSGALLNTGSLVVGSGGAGANGGIPGASGATGQNGGAPITVATGASLSTIGGMAGGAGGTGGAGAAGAVSSAELGGAGGVGGAGFAALSVASGGTVTNFLTIAGGAGGTGGTGGDAGADKANAGGAGGAGGNGGAGVYLSGGTLTNFGNFSTIVGGAGGSGGNGGANFNGKGATGGSGGAGIAGTSGVVINTGVIFGGVLGVGGFGTIIPLGANGAGISFNSGGTVTNGGTIGAYLGADAIDFGIGASRLIVLPGGVFLGAVDGGNTIGSTIVSTLELASAASVGTLAGLGTQFIDFAQVTIDAGAAWTLQLPNPSGAHSSIGGFGADDTMDLAGVDPASVTLAAGTLAFAGGAFPLSLSGASNVKATSDGSAGALVTIACFRAGTRIATMGGEIAVENLAIGDSACLVRGGTARIEWIGRRHVDCARHPRPELVWPVRVTAHAFGPGMPLRDLWLSPDHAVFQDGVLIPVKHLINGATITQVQVDEVAYYHIELDRHDVVYAEGLPCETFLDAGNRMSFANGELVALHPQFATQVWEAEGCAPLIVSGPILAAVRARLLQRSIRPGRRSRAAS
jgi:collagen type I alpha